VLIEVEHVDDHRQPAEVVESGVQVRFNGQSAEQSLGRRVDALAELARGLR
jgi:hypothetical protein